MTAKRKTEKRFIDTVDFDPKEVSSIRIVVTGRKKVFCKLKSWAYAYTLGKQMTRLTFEDLAKKEGIK